MNTKDSEDQAREIKDEKTINREVDFEKLNTSDIKKLKTLAEIKKGGS